MLQVKAVVIGAEGINENKTKKRRMEIQGNELKDIHDVDKWSFFYVLRGH